MNKTKLNNKILKQEKQILEIYDEKEYFKKLAKKYIILAFCFGLFIILAFIITIIRYSR